MKNNINLKKLWNEQVVPSSNQSELFRRIEKHKASGFKRIIFLNATLLLTILLIVFIWIYFDPQLWSTKIGIVLIILSMIIALIFSNKTIPLYKRIKEDKIQSNYNYLKNLLEIKSKESYIQTKIMNLYFAMLSIGIGLYMYAYTSMMPPLWAIVAYIVVLLWIGFNWFVLRPKIIKKNTRKIDSLIQQLKKIQSQLDNP